LRTPISARDNVIVAQKIHLKDLLKIKLLPLFRAANKNLLCLVIESNKRTIPRRDKGILCTNQFYGYLFDAPVPIIGHWYVDGHAYTDQNEDHNEYDDYEQNRRHFASLFCHSPKLADSGIERRLLLQAYPLRPEEPVSQGGSYGEIREVYDATGFERVARQLRSTRQAWGRLRGLLRGISVEKVGRWLRQGSAALVTLLLVNFASDKGLAREIDRFPYNCVTAICRNSMFLG
jgi:hypothetical protein